jgi:hypothetical protein
MNVDITVRHYDYEKKEFVVDSCVDTMALARSMDEREMAILLGNWANAGGKGLPHGIRVGEILAGSDTHRAIQQLVVNVVLGIIYGVSKTNWVDGRNRRGVEMCQSIVDHIDLVWEYFWPFERKGA